MVFRLRNTHLKIQELFCSWNIVQKSSRLLITGLLNYLYSVFLFSMFFSYLITLLVIWFDIWFSYFWLFDWMWVKVANCILRNISRNTVIHMDTVFCEIFRKIQKPVKNHDNTYNRETIWLLTLDLVFQWEIKKQ